MTILGENFFLTPGDLYFESTKMTSVYSVDLIQAYLLLVYRLSLRCVVSGITRGDVITTNRTPAGPKLARTPSACGLNL